MNVRFRVVLTLFLMKTAATLYAQIWPQDYVPAARTPHWHERVQQFAAEPPRPGCYLFLGNSITEGFDLARHFPEWPVVNRGIIADHIDGLLARLDGSVFVQQPGKLFLLIGINDIGRGCPPEHMRLLYTMLIDSLQTHLPACQFYVHAILPTSAKWKNCPPQTIQQMNHFIRQLACEKKACFIDLYPLMVDSSGQYLNPELTADGLHLNENGYRIWRSLLQQTLSTTATDTSQTEISNP